MENENNESIIIPKVRAKLFYSKKQSVYVPCDILVDVKKYGYYRFVKNGSDEVVTSGDKYCDVDEFRFGLCKAYYKEEGKNEVVTNYDYVDIYGNVYSDEEEKEILDDYLKSVVAVRDKYLQDALADKPNADLYLKELKEKLLEMFPSAIARIKQERVINQIRNIH